jgi:hypothetical protein
MTPSHQRAPRRWAAAAALALLLGAVAVGRGAPDDGLTLNQLRRMSEAELAARFAGADLGRPPEGPLRGRVVRLVDRPLPRVRAAATNAVWKGKDVSPGGAFVNRWVGGVRAVEQTVTVGPSLLDGRPVYVIEYPPDAPILGGTRDELREVAPGLYLGPLYGPCHRFRGWVALEAEPGRDCCGR